MYKADSDPYAAGAIVMATSGPRSGELCAIRLEDIDDNGDYGIVLIHYTTDGKIVEKTGKISISFAPLYCLSLRWLQ